MMKRNRETDLPTINKELLKALESHFPAQDFGYEESVCKLNYHYGQRSVVNFLKNHYNIQNENILG